MKRVLVVGVETVAGAHLAKALSNRHQVAGLSATKAVRIPGCEVCDQVPITTEAIHRELAMRSPDLVVLCGVAARSTWSLRIRETFDTQALDVTVAWSEAVSKTKARLIVVSSDAVFHGPWMF